MNPENRYLVRFDSGSGAYDRISKLNSWQEVFVEPLNQIVTSAGEVRRLSDGGLIERLAFPVKEYPDD